MSSIGSIDRVLQQAVESGAVPCVSAIAADRDGIVYEGGAGTRVAGEGGDAVGVDTHYRIMSMTKMVCTTVALQLRDRGALDFDAPVAEYCPQFAELQVLEGFDGDTPQLREPASQATVKHLVTHTSGLGYWFFNADLARWEQVTGTPNVLSGSKVIFTAPLVADPGAKYEYGINTDWLGQVCEAAGGKGLDHLVADGVTGPLGMTETAFLMNDEQKANAVPVHLQGEDGTWAASDIELSQDPEYFAGGHGLHSTPRDYLKFQRALLHGGEYEGARILDEATVDEAFTNQIGELDFPPEIPSGDLTATMPFNAGPGFKWGWGLLLNTEDAPGRRRAGSGAWAGLLNSHYWVDRDAGLTGAIYTQFLPFVTEPAFQMYVDFEEALYDAVS